MSIYRLDGRKIKDRAMLHDTLAELLHFPDWYGRNLDALYDCLTDIQEEMELQILYRNAMEEHLGEYADFLINVIGMASKENPKIRWKVEEFSTKS